MHIILHDVISYQQNARCVVIDQHYLKSSNATLHLVRSANQPQSNISIYQRSF